MGAVTAPDTSREFFERLYQREADPWGFATSDYELSRYAAILQAAQSLAKDGQPYRRALEPGCSVGVLTAQLAGIAQSVLAMDLSATAIEQAKQRCAGLPNVELRQGTVEQANATGCDLVVLSEIGYYFQADVLAQWSGRLMQQMDAGGVLVAAHWLGVSPDHVLHGDQVGEILREVAAQNGLRLEQEERNEQPGGGFRLEAWVKPWAKSVAGM